MTLLLFVCILLIGGIRTHNNTNVTLPWWPPSSSSILIGGGHFGGPGGGGGPGGPSGDVLVSIRVDVPPGWEDAEGLDALATVATIDAQEASGLPVVHVTSTLTTKLPKTIILSGSLVGGGGPATPDASNTVCPFYHESQLGSHCGLHVVNMLLGGRVHTMDSFRALAQGLHDETGGFWPIEQMLTYSGDYCQNLLQAALGARAEGHTWPLESIDFATTLVAIAEGSIDALVIQYDSQPNLPIAAHWLCFLKDDEGTWWNMDSCHEPKAMTAVEAQEALDGYRMWGAHLFRTARPNPTPPGGPSTMPVAGPTADGVQVGTPSHERVSLTPEGGLSAVATTSQNSTPSSQHRTGAFESPGHEQVSLTPEGGLSAVVTTSQNSTPSSQDTTSAVDSLNPAHVEALKAAISSPRKSHAKGIRQAYGNAFREYVGRIATEYKEEGKRIGKTASSNTFLLQTLKDLYKPEVLTDKKVKEKLRDMVYKAHKAYENGDFLQARAAGTLTTTFRRPSFAIRSAEEISTGLYDWYLRAPPRARKGRGSFYRRILILDAAYKAHCSRENIQPIPCSGTSRHNRRRWLDGWAKQKGVSFRKPNKKFKLANAEWLERLGRFWRDCIRINHHLDCPPYIAWDETPFFADELDGDVTACQRGAEVVAVNVNHGDSRTKYTVILAMSSRADVPVPLPAVVFSSSAKKEQLGKRIRKKLEEDGAPKGVPFFFTESGNTQAAMLNDFHQKIIETSILVLHVSNTLKSSNGWRVSIFDSADSHKCWMAQNAVQMLKRRWFPFCIPGGLTPDVQAPDRAKNKPFKSSARADQEEQHLQQAMAGVSVPTSSRLDILRRVEVANKQADDEIDSPLVFKQSGSTLNLDGSEDNLLATSLLRAWESLDMAKWRAEYIASNSRKLKPRELFYSLETVVAMNMEAPELDEHDMSSDDDEPAEAEVELTGAQGDLPMDEDMILQEVAVDGQVEGATEATNDEHEGQLDRAPPPPTDTLWAFCTDHKDSPRLRAHLEIYRKKKTKECSTVSTRLEMNDLVMSAGHVAPPALPPKPKPKPKPKPSPSKPPAKRKRANTDAESHASPTSQIMQAQAGLSQAQASPTPQIMQAQVGLFQAQAWAQAQVQAQAQVWAQGQAQAQAQARAQAYAVAVARAQAPAQPQPSVNASVWQNLLQVLQTSATVPYQPPQ